jgi:hypothetical protein
MKNKLLLFFVLSCCNLTYIQAQLHIGIDAGYTNTHFLVNNPKNHKMTATPHHGVRLAATAAFLYHDVLWLESGLTFQVRNGTSFDPDLTYGYMNVDDPIEAKYDPFSKYEVITNSLELPLWVGVKITPPHTHTNYFHNS